MRFTAATLALTAFSAQADAVGGPEFTDARNPPAYRELTPAEAAAVDLGHAVFNTQWQPAGAAGAGRRDGVGPLFNATACDACHNEGAHGRGPAGDGEAPAALVIQLESGSASPGMDAAGDPRYGHTLNTSALDGLAAEATVTLRYGTVQGRYADGSPWTLRSPRYVLGNLQFGPLSPQTVIEPRLAPALFGVGLLDAAIGPAAGRFGWQARSPSLRDQTTRAFSRDMGLTTDDRTTDDCTPVETACRNSPNGRTPEVAADLLDAVVLFQRTLAVPAQAEQPPAPLFGALGCPACHRPTLAAALPGTATLPSAAHSRDAVTIAPFTDLLVHDLGSALSDLDASGHRVHSRWRTAPLWGMAHRLRLDPGSTFLHDGRARSIEEAILWHHGEAAVSRHRFTLLSRRQRAELVHWIASL